MSNYRLYRLDPRSSRFIGAEEIHAADDATAIEEAKKRAYGTSVELWDGPRKVTRIDAAVDGSPVAPALARQSLH